MKYLSVCSGIEAASVAWSSLGWDPVAFSEIEPFPSAVLAERFPDIPNLGDMTNYEEWNLPTIDLLVGGTPCQSFSVAGQRKSLGDDRGNLCLFFCRIADKFNPQWVLWENVPGVLSSRDNAFGCFLGELCGADSPLLRDGRWPDCGVVCGPRRTVAWRVLDAQWFGVAQRRRRVFVLASRGYRNFRCANVLLPVGEGLPGYFEKSGGKRDQVAGLVGKSSQESMFVGDYSSYNCGYGGRFNSSLGISRGDISPTLVSKGPAIVCMAGNTIGRSLHNGGNGRGYSTDGVSYTLTTSDIHCVCYENHGQDSRVKELKDGVSNTISAKMGTGGGNVNIVLHILQDPVSDENVAPCLSGANQANIGIFNGSLVRKLMPVECERLQGFPDDWTRIPWRGKPEEVCPDSPRYKAIGNSMAVPVIRWIGRRIEKISRKEAH